MRMLAITDGFFTEELVALAAPPTLEGLGPVEVRAWRHDSVAALQDDILKIEKGGPDAIALPSVLADDLGGAEVLMVQFAPVSAAVMRNAPQLKLIVINRAGVENIDLVAARAAGVRVLATPGRNAPSVAEYAVGLMLAESRNIARAHAALANGQWQRDFPNSAHTPEIGGRTVGLIGYGRIGAVVHRLLGGFGCELLVHDPFLEEAPKGATLVTLDHLLARSDFVSLHARLDASTQHLIDATRLARMKPTAILVNTARAGLVDETALLAALDAGRLAGAALDVFDQEPLPAGHPLLRHPRITHTTHLAGTTHDGFYTGPRLIAGHLARLLRGDTDALPFAA